MPKIQINYPSRHSVANEPDGAPVGEAVTDATLNVNWLKDPAGGGHVQLSMDLPLGYLKLLLDSPNGTYVDGSSLAWTPVLPRREVNSLIRALRAARDQAYGADE